MSPDWLVAVPELGTVDEIVLMTRVTELIDELQVHLHCKDNAFLNAYEIERVALATLP